VVGGAGGAIKIKKEKNTKRIKMKNQMGYTNNPDNE
jgi:hypothetical protein